ncbi:MAG TPA: hypothetical protein VKB79_21815 [Bryobacteraceae bacterium]|nr:hypothetical protein [Bryobacteraceae bacterium]
MRENQALLDLQPRDRAEDPLDIVVPFTNPRETIAALRAASWLGEGLKARIRVVRVQVVPYPLDTNHPHIPVSFLRNQMSALTRGFDVDCEVRLAREFEQGLKRAISARSITVLASKKRPWPTRVERLAARLRKDGSHVFVVSEQNA